MTKAKKYDVIISEIMMTKSPSKIQETLIDSYCNATLHKVQLLIGRFMIEHSKAEFFKCVNNAIGLLFVITDYSNNNGSIENPKIIRMTVKEAG